MANLSLLYKTKDRIEKRIEKAQEELSRVLQEIEFAEDEKAKFESLIQSKLKDGLTLTDLMKRINSENNNDQTSF